MYTLVNLRSDMDPVVEKQPPALATRNEKTYMAIVAFQSLVISAIAFSVFSLIEVNVPDQTAQLRTVPVYLSVFIMAQIFSLLYSFDALRGRNIIQLGLHLIFNVAMLAYSIVQIPQTKSALQNEQGSGACFTSDAQYWNCIGPGSLYNLVEKLLIVTPIVIGVAMFLLAYHVRLLFVDWGWAIFHLVGASPQLKRMHREYQTLISLLKLLMFFALAYCTASLILVTSATKKTAEFVITIIAIPVSAVIMLLCGWALREENKIGMGFCLFSMVLGLAYFIYKLTSMWLPNTAFLYINTKITMAIFAVFAILILLTTFVYGCICTSNFGKGLIQAHQNPENRTSLWSIPVNIRTQEPTNSDLEEKPARPTTQLIIE